MIRRSESCSPIWTMRSVSARPRSSLSLSRFELQERFHRLGIPLRFGPATLEEARAEVAAALKVD